MATGTIYLSDIMDSYAEYAQYGGYEDADND